MKHWIVTGESESGDSYRKVWFSKPTDFELDEWAHHCDGFGTNSEPDGPGRAGSWVHVTVTEGT